MDESLKNGLNLRDQGFSRVGPEVPTMERIRAWYGPARTLGLPAGDREGAVAAMDAALDSAGVYSLIQHAWSMGQGGFGQQFLGYAALSGLAQNGLIRASVTTLADDMTSKWIAVGYEEERGRAGQGTEGLPSCRSLKAHRSDRIVRIMEAACREYGLQEVFRQAAELTGLFGGCMIYVDTGRGSDLMTPLPADPCNAELADGIRGFTVVEPVNCYPGEYNSTDPLAPDYFRPAWWWVLSRPVHASRLIRLASNEPPMLLKPSYNFFGIPHAQILYDYVLHFQQCRVASQRLMTKFSDLVFKTDMADILTRAGGTAQLDRRLRLMAENRSNDGIAAIDKDMEDVVKLDTSLAGVADIVRQSLEIFTVMDRKPAVKILGISPSGFNATGESDIANYADHVRSQQEKLIRPGLTRILDLIQAGRLGRVDPAVTFTFNPISEKDALRDAQIRKLRAEAEALERERTEPRRESSNL